MSAAVAGAYDENAELYASLFLHDLDAQTLGHLTAFADLASKVDGDVIDVGCGPGGTVAHLSSLGLAVRGIDISPRQIEQARAAFPELSFSVGDLTRLDADDRSVGGITSKYSIIHLPPESRRAAFAEWRRVLRPGAPLFVSFFGSRSAEAHGTPFDHKVITAYELFPANVVVELESAGVDVIDVIATPIPEGGRPFDHTTVLARSAA